MEKPKENIIRFPAKREKTEDKASTRIGKIDSLKYFNGNQIRLLRRAVRNQAELDSKYIHSKHIDLCRCDG